MKKLLFFLLILATLFAIGCGEKNPDNAPDNGDNTGTESPYKDPTHQTGTYKIIFKMGPKSIVHYYEAGEMPEPPVFEDYVMDTMTIHPTGEWEEEFVPVDGDKTYRAKYEQITNSCVITFETKSGTFEVNTPIQSMPKIPDIPDYNGMKFVGFDKTVKLCTEPATYTAIYSNIYTGEAFKNMLNFTLVSYSSTLTDTDDRGGIHDSCFALYSLVHHEHENPQDGAVARRIVEHLTNIVSPGNAPSFDLWTNWSYSVMCASIALAKDTPTVYSKLSADIRTRLDTMMECYAYIESLGTSDENEIKTGPGFYGNFSKSWNPNYRLGNIGVMVFVTHYFGSGDLSRGAEVVNGMIMGFNEAKYTEIVNRFIQYGWARATNIWSNEGRTDASGNQGYGAKDLLLWGTRGGRFYISYKNGDANTLTTGVGSGVGVNNGGKPYKYHEIGLERADLILLDIIAYNYSGGAVKNNHYYDLDGDGIKELVAGLQENVSSPYLGQEGMMLEFASGNRSSASYCRGDFLLCNALVSAGVALDIIELGEGDALWEKMIVGNEDFLFKYKSGYHSYSTGSYGESSKTDLESAYKGKQYFAIKELWFWMRDTY